MRAGVGANWREDWPSPAQGRKAHLNTVANSFFGKKTNERNILLRRGFGPAHRCLSSGAGERYHYAKFTPDAALMAVILVVEDDAFILQSLGWVLEDMGHNALAASDLAGALVHLVARLRLGGFRLLDTQWVTTHLMQFGAEEMLRLDYRQLLEKAVVQTAHFEADPDPDILQAEFIRLAKGDS